MKTLAEQHPEIPAEYPDYYVYEYEVAEYDTINALRQISPEDVVFFSWEVVYNKELRHRPFQERLFKCENLPFSYETENRKISNIAG